MLVSFYLTDKKRVAKEVDKRLCTVAIDALGETICYMIFPCPELFGTMKNMIFVSSMTFHFQELISSN